MYPSPTVMLDGAKDRSCTMDDCKASTIHLSPPTSVANAGDCTDEHGASQDPSVTISQMLQSAAAASTAPTYLLSLHIKAVGAAAAHSEQLQPPRVVLDAGHEVPQLPVLDAVWPVCMLSTGNF
jgi:hypothetical protein